MQHGVLTSYKPFLSWKVTSVGAVSRGCTWPPPLLLVTTHRLPKARLSPHGHIQADMQGPLSMLLLGDDGYLAGNVGGMSPVHVQRRRLDVHEGLIMVVMLVTGQLVKGQMHYWFVNNDG